MNKVSLVQLDPRLRFISGLTPRYLFVSIMFFEVLVRLYPSTITTTSSFIIVIIIILCVSFLCVYFCLYMCLHFYVGSDFVIYCTMGLLCHDINTRKQKITVSVTFLRQYLREKHKGK